MADQGLLQRITSNPAIFGRKPIVRGLRISVAMVLSQLAQGVRLADVLEDYPDLEPDDVRACLAFAEAVTAHPHNDLEVGKATTPSASTRHDFLPRPARTAKDLLARITVESSKCGGRPCIRGLRIRVTDILQLLVHEAPHEEILTDHPNLVRDDILAALAYAAHQTGVAPSRNS